MASEQDLVCTKLKGGQKHSSKHLGFSWILWPWVNGIGWDLEGCCCMFIEMATFGITHHYFNVAGYSSISRCRKELVKHRKNGRKRRWLCLKCWSQTNATRTQQALNQLWEETFGRTWNRLNRSVVFLYQILLCVQEGYLLQRIWFDRFKTFCWNLLRSLFEQNSSSIRFVHHMIMYVSHSFELADGLAFFLLVKIKHKRK